MLALRAAGGGPWQHFSRWECFASAWQGLGTAHHRLGKARGVEVPLRISPYPGWCVLLAFSLVVPCRQQSLRQAAQGVLARGFCLRAARTVLGTGVNDWRRVQEDAQHRHACEAWIPCVSMGAADGWDGGCLAGMPREG